MTSLIKSDTSSSRRLLPLLLLLSFPALSFAQLPVKITHNETDHQYDVHVGGALFTSYRYGEKYRDKPIFYPVLSPRGAEVNRSYPMIEGVEGENADHPHHQSMWFTYGDVNGVDYWNRQRSGRRIQHRSASIDGDTLTMVRDWIDPEGVKVVEETTAVTFGGGDDVRWSDHAITIMANEVEAHFGDTKEGAFGIRVAGSLRENDRTGHYINAEGLETSKNVWGKQSAWVALTGTVKDSDGEDEDVTIAIFSHPTSHNHPPYWHARDYGLFTVNPFGRRGYDRTAEPLSTRLQPGAEGHLKFRLAVYDGKIDKARLDADYAAFAGSSD